MCDSRVSLRGCLDISLSLPRGVGRKRAFTVLLERDEDGYYVASVPELPGCHAQPRSLDELEQRIREAVTLYFEAEGEVAPGLEFVGLQRIEVDLP